MCSSLTGANVNGISAMLSPQLLRSLVLNLSVTTNTLHSAAHFALSALLSACHQDGEKSAGVWE